ncbi:MAG: lasso peptide biosynthesis B2 protein [Chloroflexi bacterium]|nr:lasso peptide biosynthesis B2 protein [Chloroflexota bacterium]
MNLSRGISNLIIALKALRLPATRRVLQEAWRLERALPHWLNALPLPELMRRLDDEAAASRADGDPAAITRLADAAVGLNFFSPLGLCLRRSLVRYVLLRRAGVPVTVHFGAKKDSEAGQSRLSGHAWLTLNAKPYAERPDDYRGFTPIYSYPSGT